MKKIIEIKAVSKKFAKSYNSSRKQLRDEIKRYFFNCHKGHENKSLNKNEFWALQDVSFDIYENERIAIMGANGSGKSTLLKMINGIMLPDQGEVKVRGEVGSILELGIGMKPALTGLENIYLAGSYFGKSEEEVESIIDSIIEFTELEEFMSTPVSYYSTGMRGRLAFATYIFLQPDILILDEVFATGDSRFREKAEKKMHELCQSTTTILVSHSTGLVSLLADRVIVLNKGKTVFIGPTTEGIKFYEEMMKS